MNKKLHGIIQIATRINLNKFIRNQFMGMGVCSNVFGEVLNVCTQAYRALHFFSNVRQLHRDKSVKQQRINISSV